VIVSVIAPSLVAAIVMHLAATVIAATVTRVVFVCQGRLRDQARESAEGRGSRYGNSPTAIDVDHAVTPW
jgi:hypothetical protein